MYEGDGIEKTGNQKLDYEILRWFNDRMIELVNMYIDIGNDCGWNEDFLMRCFPRNFVEDNLLLCKRIVFDIRDILKSDIIFTDIRLLYQFVLFHIITIEIETIDDLWEEGFEKGFLPIGEELIKKIYQEKQYVYNSALTQELVDDECHPIHFINSLQSEGIFYDVIFDDTEFDIDTCDRCVMYCTQKIKNKEWQPYDISEVLELASRTVKEEYYKVAKDSNDLSLNDEMFIIQEIDSIIKLLCNRITDINKLTENEISNYVEYMLKRLLFLNRNIQIEREALLGFSSIKIGEADMVLYRNNERGYDNIAVIENKFYNAQFKEIKQLLGYMNMHFKFGVTITINKERKLIDVVDSMQKYMEQEKESLHLIKVEKKKEYIIYSTMKKPQDDQIMNCYHFILNLNEDERKNWSREARK